MSDNQRFPVWFFFVALAGSYSLWFVSSIDKPLWGDELITVSLVKSVSLKQLFSAVLLGLDATPPLYTGYGWLILHYVDTEISPELLLRITNAGLIASTLWVLYLSIRQHFDPVVALATLAVFVLLKIRELEFLTLEIRAYAALVFFTTLAIYAAQRALARTPGRNLTYAMLAYCLLVSSHTFGVVYVVSIVTCTILSTAAKGDIKLALNLGFIGGPPVLAFLLWIPILHYQAQLGNWLSRPDFHILLQTIYSPVDFLWQFGLLLLITVLTSLWRYIQSPMRPQWWRAITCNQIFVLMLPVAFGASTFTVWLFSRFVFPVFLPKYFFPNIILHAIWLSLLVDFVFFYLTSAKAKYGLVLASAVLVSLTLMFRQSPGFWLPCFDSAKMTYLEDRYRDNELIVTLSPQPWLTRLNRPGERVVHPIDEGSLQKKDGAEYPRYVYSYNFLSRFEEWLGINTAMTSSQLLNWKPGLLVIDDGAGPWLEWLQYIRLHRKVTHTVIEEDPGCTLRRLDVLE
jgi:hypothetical protein